MIVPIEHFNNMKKEYHCIVATIIDIAAIIHYNGFNKAYANEISIQRECDLWVNGKLVKTFEKQSLADMCDGYFKEVEKELEQ